MGAVEDGDAVVTFNFRADRVVEISQALECADFKKFDRKRWPDVGGCGVWVQARCYRTALLRAAKRGRPAGGGGPPALPCLACPGSCWRAEAHCSLSCSASTVLHKRKCKCRSGLQASCNMMESCSCLNTFWCRRRSSSERASSMSLAMGFECLRAARAKR